MDKFRLRTLRASKDWTQKDLADRLGVSKTTIVAWEQDLSNVAVSKVQAIADLFGVNINDILY